MKLPDVRTAVAKVLRPDIFKRASILDRIDVIERSSKPELAPPYMMQTGYIGEEFGVKHPEPYLGSYAHLYDMVYKLYILRQVVEKITMETFRNTEESWEWVGEYAARCETCGKEFEKKKPETCDKCGGNEFESPSTTERDKFEPYIKKANKNNQSYFTILREISKDLDIADDAYLVILKRYVLTEKGEILIATPTEIIRGNPESFRIVADNTGTLGGRWYKCLVKDCEYILDEPDRHAAYHKRCPEHDTVLHEVHYVTVKRGATDPLQFYINGEVMHKSKYVPSLLYGHSPVITLFPICDALEHMVSYVRRMYVKSKLPSSALFVRTSNPTSLRKQWKEALEEKVKNPNYFPILGIDSDHAGNFSEFVSFMDSIDQLRYLDILEEFRRGISAEYGVTLIFQADSSASGGLNNEGLQITVTNRAVEASRSAIMDVVAFTMEQFGIDGWILSLPPAEERDLMAEKQRFYQEVQNAEGMLRLGYVPTLEDDDTFTYRHNPEGAKELLDVGGGQDEFGSPFGDQRAQGAPETMSKKKSLDKARRYIDDPSQAPEGANVQQGGRGGYYYESEGVEGEEDTPDKPSSSDISSEDVSDATDQMKDYIRDSKDKDYLEVQMQLEDVAEYTRYGYGYINDHLRKPEGERSAKDKERTDPKVDRISTFLKDAPKIKGAVYRGMSFNVLNKEAQKEYEEFVSKLVEGKRIEFPAFVSTSVDSMAAQGFMSPDPSSRNIIFKIGGGSGVLLDGASNTSWENEVLFDKGSRFTIKSVVKEGNTMAVHLEEI